MKLAKKISIVVPCFNEAQSIQELYDNLIKVLAKTLIKLSYNSCIDCASLKHGTTIDIFFANFITYSEILQ